MLKHFYRKISDIFEYCFNILVSDDLSANEIKALFWLLAGNLESNSFGPHSFLEAGDDEIIVEVGPLMNFTTAWSTNAVAVCHSCGLKKIVRIERSRRHVVKKEKIKPFVDSVHDRMIECRYFEPLKTFETGIKPEPVKIIPLMEEGKFALEEINKEMGLGLDDWDIGYYYNLFINDIGRNPTNVECFDLSQSNSEHSRHWFFKGKLVIDGRKIPHTLMDIIGVPLKSNPGNSVIAFSDNSSSIEGYSVKVIIPAKPGQPSPFIEQRLSLDLIFTAETHNFPSGVAPFPGAETGTGGRIRDVEAIGRGGLVIAGTAAYCVGNLQIPEYELPWESKSFNYPSSLASPLKIEIQASNGASDYGNKFGEPVIQGFTRSFGLRLPNKERYEWIKPIMFTGGIGQMDTRHIKKRAPEKGMLVVKMGGPGYRIGVGGGAASSMIQGENKEKLDFNAVQRGDAEMAKKGDRVIRACIEMGEKNPIESIHDQGAGGNCNVVKEVIYPAGAKIEVRNIQLGDNTLSVLEIWGAEYQEQNALLLNPENYEMFEAMCAREKVPCAVIGKITGDGYIILHDESDGTTPVNLDLKKIIGEEMPQKTFHLDRIPIKHKPLKLPEGLTVRDALERVLRLVSVGSKRFLTNKVDRSVTGLIARQQCAGPLQLTVSDVAVVAQSHFGITGAAISIGEQPIKSLLNPAAMARMSVAEALTNIVWAKISALEDIKCSANWMWAGKLPGEGAKIYDAAVAMSNIMTGLGIAVDGGKDSMSMAAMVGEETVKSPGTLVISAYAPCPDITKVITPDIKKPGESRLLFIDLAKGKRRLGGSALAQCYSQIGDECPDVEDPELLKCAFNAIQKMIDMNLILAGHDTTGDGLLVALLEMIFAGNCGFKGHLNCTENEVINELFTEEAGMIIEYLADQEDDLFSFLDELTMPYQLLGITTVEKEVVLMVNIPMSKDSGFFKVVLQEDMRELRQIWEETSYQLERLQANPKHAEEEKKNIYDRSGPQYHLSFTPKQTPDKWMNTTNKPKVAIIREEGSNGDREMTSAFYQSGFEPWDITMTDIFESRFTLKNVRGVAFVGGFSYADVLDSAKGWAGVIRFNEKLRVEFDEFYNRLDTFSLGVCNGCQLMALLNWVPFKGLPDMEQPRFIRNVSGRFESRFSAVKILKSRSIMLSGMEDSVLGVWVAHGEGQAYFPSEFYREETRDENLAPIRYVDDQCFITNDYPFNPNDSRDGIAAFCDTTGRHLAMMPHPERTFLKWQWPWMPDDMKSLEASPWMRIFQNAREWCEKTKELLKRR